MNSGGIVVLIVVLISGINHNEEKTLRCTIKYGS